jgi:hypothetical protein
MLTYADVCRRAIESRLSGAGLLHSHSMGQSVKRKIANENRTATLADHEYECSV